MDRFLSFFLVVVGEKSDDEGLLKKSLILLKGKVMNVSKLSFITNTSNNIIPFPEMSQAAFTPPPTPLTSSLHIIVCIVQCYLLFAIIIFVVVTAWVRLQLQYFDDIVKRNNSFAQQRQKSKNSRLAVSLSSTNGCNTRREIQEKIQWQKNVFREKKK